MRKIVAGLCMAEDGIVERPDRWLPRSALEQLLPQSGTVVLGRRTFEQYAGMLGGLEHTRNLVVGSRPLVVHPGTEWLQGDPRRVLTALKSVPGDDLQMIGSLRLLRSLLRWRLVDEMTLLIHPVAARRGTFLDRGRLRLISMVAADGGVLEATYRVRYAATGRSSTALSSAGRCGGTRSRDRVAMTRSAAVRTHA